MTIFYSSIKSIILNSFYFIFFIVVNFNVSLKHFFVYFLFCSSFVKRIIGEKYHKFFFALTIYVCKHISLLDIAFIIDKIFGLKFLIIFGFNLSIIHPDFFPNQ